MLPNDLFSESTGINAHWDAVRMTADAESAKNLASLLIEQYGANQIMAQIKSPSLCLDLSFTAVALAGDPRKIANEEVNFKLFHETGSPEDEEGPEYFEMFFNVNLGSNIAELNEKDTDFRIGLLNALKTVSE